MPAAKKQKVGPPDVEAEISEYAALISDINSEVDLEIALRLKLMETLESRISWAQLLQVSIKGVNGGVSSENFQTVALDALSAFEDSTRHIIDPEPIPPPPSIPPQRLSRPPRKLLSSNFKPKPSFLYTRSSLLVNEEENHQNHLYILKCPGCSRTTFTSLQGLLNHARLTHNLEWGTHDDCIRACAVSDNDLEVDAGIEVGSGPSGILPGLRTIFQMAVGAQNKLKEHPGDNTTTAATAENQDTHVDENYLNQTLGLHKDSPSLALFLGKEVIRRRIKVWDEDEPIEIKEDDKTKRRETKTLTLPWKMPFAPRNFVDNSTSHSLEQADENALVTTAETDIVKSIAMPLPSSVGPQNITSAQGRFHFIARIIITDRSLSLPAEPRLEEHKGYTHKWMISVDAPAYAYPITSLLNGLRVTPSDPMVSMPTPPEATSPPFVVVGLADKPFLARVELSFAGTTSNPTVPHQRLVFEHWVGLDPFKYQTVILGQDQVLDVELDKNTALNPPRFGYTPIDSKSLWNQPLTPDLPGTVPVRVKETPSNLPLDGSILAKAAKRFPMFLTDVRGSQPQSPGFPYTLPSSKEYFNTLVLGRRKAIEWGRARAIRDAYNQQIRKTQSSSMASATDVYSWLFDNGHLPGKGYDGPRIKKETYGIKEEESETSSKRHVERSSWCSICGLDGSTHKKVIVKKEYQEEGHETKPKTPMAAHELILASDTSCGIVPRVLHIARLPRMDVQHLVLDEQRHPSPKAMFPRIGYNSLVSTVDPRLLLSIREAVDQLGLSKFRTSTKTSELRKDAFSYPLDDVGEHRFDVEETLAPFALLTVLTKSFVRQLVDRGLDVANRDKAISAGMIQKSKRRMAENTAKTERLLTPTHILSGILTRGRGRGNSQDALDTLILSCLSKLGAVAEPEPSCQGEQQIRLKLEER